ncbi:sodium-dependent phosphate transport protein 2B [Lingula anatina]|uniref:Sodium-dependent phosphate transport protein 2B n=1 Tax=Lingula anatina TaxID=7574 RepID=A0A1S3JR07_LINAN|nr:sodium-dependent phosphate transport protein 2B [Lingula anatina]|eukprot:XP_013412414.1 sodium-dependent phosphate transport protein 2B [Lingula anatina]
MTTGEENSDKKMTENGEGGYANPAFDENQREDVVGDRVEKEEDPWELPELKETGTPWSELTCGGKITRVLVVTLKLCLLLFLLYVFICSLDFLSSAFRLLGGKAAGEAFSQNEILANPVAGLMIGLLATVLVQSSSTSTSIIVSMVGSGILGVKQAIPIIMGANIGTSVTNTLVAMTQAGDKSEFRRAFAGATVHDMFNWLTVIILLPIEAIFHPLYYMTLAIINSLGLKTNKNANPELLKALTKPFVKLIIQVDKKTITAIAKGSDTDGLRIMKMSCKTGNKIPKGYRTFADNVATQANLTSAPSNITDASSNATSTITSVTAPLVAGGNSSHGWNETHIWGLGDEKEKCTYIFRGLADVWYDEAIGALLLVIALVILCVVLVCIVKLLHSMLQGRIAILIRKVINADFPGKLACLTGYVAIIFGCLMTILVQSSSIFTSALTPLVGVGVVKIERMYPMTLGSNIGTTVTAILASLTQGKEDLPNALQVAFCHLFFNIFGILIWFPVPMMRKAPISLAKFLGNTTANYRWFAVIYIILMFFIFPGIVFALSIPGWYVMVGVLGPIVLILIVVLIINVLRKRKPEWLPGRLRTWQWLPLPLRSLAPYDRLIVRACCCCKCCDRCKNKDDVESADPGNIDDGGEYRNKDSFNVTASQDHLVETTKF